MRLPVSQFIAWALPHALRNPDVVRYAGQIDKRKQWQYILGDYGQDVNGMLTMDCNGLAEAFLNFMLPGTNHNTKARFNYANWCTEKGVDLTKVQLQPGMAVFVGRTAAVIEHVGFLVCKWGPGPLDWLVMQEESQRLGFRLTKLLTGPGHFTFWGKMDKFFTYDLDTSFNPFKTPVPFNFAACPYPVPQVLPDYGSSGDEVRALQWLLIMHDHLIDSSGPLRNGIDGNFGRLTRNALTAYQNATDVEGDTTIKALLGQPVTPTAPQSYGININDVPWLSYKSSGKAVAYMQSLLKAKGEDLHLSVKANGFYGMDGDFGTETVAALRHFQQHHHDLAGNQLDDDGVCGPKTWGALLGIPCQ